MTRLPGLCLDGSCKQRAKCTVSPETDRGRSCEASLLINERWSLERAGGAGLDGFTESCAEHLAARHHCGKSEAPQRRESRAPDGQMTFMMTAPPTCIIWLNSHNDAAQSAHCYEHNTERRGVHACVCLHATAHRHLPAGFVGLSVICRCAL